uniref:PH domain-containing protein n=1 Tax=Mycena chlorophos TaxID=658473 RepID=A0ABQ0LXT4_MYCCL|nr:predicted protein [Mycena chlorophos]
MCSRVYDCVVGSVSYARPGGETLRTTSTAQEVIVVAPAASNLRWQRWHEPPQPTPAQALAPSPQPEDLPSTQSIRTAFILDRFSTNCTITQYININITHQLIAPSAARRRPFFDFVARDDEALVRSWLGAVKTCGVNDRGQPSNGGFAYGRFLMCPQGRDSTAVAPLPLLGWRAKPRQSQSSVNNDGKTMLYGEQKTLHGGHHFPPPVDLNLLNNLLMPFIFDDFFAVSVGTMGTSTTSGGVLKRRRLGSRDDDDALVERLGTLPLPLLILLVGRRKRLLGVVGRRTSPDWSLRIGRMIPAAGSSMLRRENRGVFIVASQLSSAEVCCCGREEVVGLVVARVWKDLGRGCGTGMAMDLGRSVFVDPALVVETEVPSLCAVRRVCSSPVLPAGMAWDEIRRWLGLGRSPSTKEVSDPESETTDGDRDDGADADSRFAMARLPVILPSVNDVPVPAEKAAGPASGDERNGAVLCRRRRLASSSACTCCGSGSGAAAGGLCASALTFLGTSILIARVRGSSWKEWNGRPEGREGDERTVPPAVACYCP